MSLNALIKALAEICEEKNLKAAASESLKGGLMTGIAATLGGLLLGPVGLALGGAFGGLAAAATSQGKFKPVAQILMEMPPCQRQLLYNRIEKEFSKIKYHDILALIMLIQSTAAFKELALKTVTSFLTEEMHLSIQS